MTGSVNALLTQRASDRNSTTPGTRDMRVPSRELDLSPRWDHAERDSLASLSNLPLGVPNAHLLT